MECGQRKSLAHQAHFQGCLAITPSLPTHSLSHPRRQTILCLSHSNRQHFAPILTLTWWPFILFHWGNGRFQKRISTSSYLLISLSSHICDPLFCLASLSITMGKQPYSHFRFALDLIPACLFKDFAPTILPSLHCQILSPLHLSQNIQICLYFCHLENV